MSLKIILFIVTPIILLFPAWEIYGIKKRYQKCRQGSFPVNTFRLLSKQTNAGFFLHVFINIYLLAFISLITLKFGEAFNLGAIYNFTVYGLPLVSAAMLFSYMYYLEKLKKEFDPILDKKSIIKFRAKEMIKVLWPIPACLLCVLYFVFFGKK